jgi:hypothetical protein
MTRLQETGKIGVSNTGRQTTFGLLRCQHYLLASDEYMDSTQGAGKNEV